MNQNTLDYLVTDFLEMHFSQEKKALTQIKKRLFSKQMKVQELCALPCFFLEHIIVAVQDGGFKKPTELLLLNAKERSFKTFILK